MALSSSQGEPINDMISSTSTERKIAELTWRRQHLVSGEHCIGTGHEAHRLLCFTERAASSSQSDNSRGQNDASRRNGPNERVVFNRLK